MRFRCKVAGFTASEVPKHGKREVTTMSNEQPGRSSTQEETPGQTATRRARASALLAALALGSVPMHIAMSLSAAQQESTLSMFAGFAGVAAGSVSAGFALDGWHVSKTAETEVIALEFDERHRPPPISGTSTGESLGEASLSMEQIDSRRTIIHEALRGAASRIRYSRWALGASLLLGLLAGTGVLQGREAHPAAVEFVAPASESSELAEAYAGARTKLALASVDTPLESEPAMVAKSAADITPSAEGSLGALSIDGHSVVAPDAGVSPAL
jgi:hypothetical protein